MLFFSLHSLLHSQEQPEQSREPETLCQSCRRPKFAENKKTKCNKGKSAQTQIMPSHLVTMAILKPIPGCPRRFSRGIRQSSKIKFAVDEALIPSLSSFFPSERPGDGISTKKALIPCRRKTLISVDIHTNMYTKKKVAETT